MKFYFNYSLALLEIQIGRILSGAFFKQKTEKVLYLKIEKPEPEPEDEDKFFDFLEVEFADEEIPETEFGTTENTLLCGTLLKFTSLKGEGYVRLEDFLKWVFETRQLLVCLEEPLLFEVKIPFEFEQFLPSDYWDPKSKMIKISQGEQLEVFGIQSERLSVKFANPELEEIQHFAGKGFLKLLLEGSISPVCPIMNESDIDGVW